MDWNLEPPVPTGKEQWVEDKVAKWLDNMALTIEGEVVGVDLFDYLDVEKLSRELTRHAENLYDDMVTEAQVEAREARLESQRIY